MADKLRCYFVIDMKSFFASVECSIRGLDPMTTDLVVADKERSESTICLAVSPSMKAKGVKNRCRLFEIPKNMEYIIAPPQMQKYIDFASDIYEIYLQYIDKNDIHVYSIDECFIDATDYLDIYHLTAKEFAKKLMDEIYDKLRIPATCGIGTNLYLAKIALDITAKHATDRIGWLTEEKFIKTLRHHTPITDFWGISTGTQNRLLSLGITDMAGIAHCDEDKLYKEFGINAELLIDHSWGKETCLMSDIKAYKRKGGRSFSNSQILPQPYKYEDAKIVLSEMIQDGCYRLAREGMVTNRMDIFVGYQKAQDGDKLGYMGRAGVHKTCKMEVVTNVYSIIGKYAEKIFDELVDKSREIRQLAYAFEDLKPEGQAEQYNFFYDYEQINREKKMVKTILTIQDKFGKNALLRGFDLHEKSTQRERNEMIGGHRSGGKSKNEQK